MEEETEFVTNLKGYLKDVREQTRFFDQGTFRVILQEAIDDPARGVSFFMDILYNVKSLIFRVHLIKFLVLVKC